MTYKRIIAINDTRIAEAMADEAKHFGVTFRAALNGNANEFVIEGTAKQARNIETIVASVEAMDAQSAELL
jgi:hypothetical protein